MSELKNKVEELIVCVKRTAKSRYIASERLVRHQNLSQWTIASLACSLVLISLTRTLGISTGVTETYLNAVQAILAILILVYALLLGRENFMSQAQTMHRSGVALDHLSRKLAARDYQRVSDAEYAAFTKEYFDLLEKPDNHKSIDYLFMRLGSKPRSAKEWPKYIWDWIRALLITVCNCMHHIVSLALVAVVFYSLVVGLNQQARKGDLELRSSAALNKSWYRESSDPINLPLPEKERKGRQ